MAANPDRDAETAELVAARATDAMRLVLGELRPLVGDLAVRALYRRSLHLARSSFQQTVSLDVETHEVDFLAPLHQDLSARAVVDSRRAGHALLSALADLLVSLIGEPVTNRLLQKALGTDAQAPVSEQKP